MNLCEAQDYDDLSRQAAVLLSTWATKSEQPGIVLPTGNTPLGLYRVLASKPFAKVLSRARPIQLDEYYGIAHDDWRSLAGWLYRDLLAPLGMRPEAMVRFDSSAEDGDREAARVESAVGSMGIDIAILGLGPNGHIGMNEPGSDFASKTRLVTLTPETIHSNASYWGGEDKVPHLGLTLGLGTLARARHTMLLVSGARKAKMLAAVFDGPISPRIPATYLRTIPGTTVIADRAALAVMRHRGGFPWHAHGKS
jgi:glucosamine-6-phosphate deaminase